MINAFQMTIMSEIVVIIILILIIIATLKKKVRSIEYELRSHTGRYEYSKEKV